MTDSYFDRYVTLAVVDLKYFEQEEAKKKFQEIMEAYESIKIQRGLN